jgi:hypothetical protein
MSSVYGQQSPNVTTVFPEAQTLSAETDRHILIIFDQAIDTQSNTGIDELHDLVFLYENELQSSMDRLKQTAEYFQLYQNYLNPLNPSTTIEFFIPMSEYVPLKIYDTVGQEAATLVSKTLAVGNYKYEWSRPFGIASGVYLYQLKTNSFQKTKKMIFLP